ncbi:hypothetical protein K8R04_01085 [Candidatus Uhrbacteria bacterium]|nr:hypothetical protein [Candidatus Uhrbacteria bacterium]
MKKHILKLAALHVLATALYIVAVVSLLFSMPRSVDQSNSILLPIGMLLLFVFSALFTGSLVLGRPVLWYLDGKKKEAISLLMASIGMLFVVTLLVFSAAILFATR